MSKQPTFNTFEILVNYETIYKVKNVRSIPKTMSMYLNMADEMARRVRENIKYIQTGEDKKVIVELVVNHISVHRRIYNDPVITDKEESRMSNDFFNYSINNVGNYVDAKTYALQVDNDISKWVIKDDVPESENNRCAEFGIYANGELKTYDNFTELRKNHSLYSSLIYKAYGSLANILDNFSIKQGECEVFNVIVNATVTGYALLTRRSDEQLIMVVVPRGSIAFDSHSGIREVVLEYVSGGQTKPQKNVTKNKSEPNETLEDVIDLPIYDVYAYGIYKDGEITWGEKIKDATVAKKLLAWLDAAQMTIDELHQNEIAVRDIRVYYEKDYLGYLVLGVTKETGYRNYAVYIPPEQLKNKDVVKGVIKDITKRLFRSVM